MEVIKLRKGRLTGAYRSQHFTAAFAQRRLHEQSEVAAGCMGERSYMGKGKRGDRAGGC